ncbi:MAG: glycosyltransferase, partial [Planctomycetota bacterium]
MKSPNRPAAETPSIGVAIVCLNEVRGIGRCIDSVASAEQIVVADGGSSDGTLEKLRDLQMQQPRQMEVVQGARGRAAQLNAAAKSLSDKSVDVILFMHADNWLADGAIEQIQNAFHQREALQWAAMRQRIDDSGWRYRWIEWGNALRVRWRSMPFGDQAVSVRREVFEEVGGFPDVPIMEDLIFSQRLRRRSRPA